MKVAIKNLGFTLVELMVTLTVLAVLVAFAVPSMQEFVVSNRFSTDLNTFVSTINYARSEAIARNRVVIICPQSNAGIACVNNQFWGQFQIQVFIDVDGNGNRDTGDVLLKTLPAIDLNATQYGFVQNGAVFPNIIFFSGGYSAAFHSFDMWTIKAGDLAFEQRNGRRICISRPGRVKIISYLSNCNAF